MANESSQAALPPLPPVWCVVGNVRKEIHYGPDKQFVRTGTNKFAGGAKIYIASAFWGTGAERIMVIGHYRGKGYISCVVRADWLSNCRVEMVYSPTVLKRLAAHPEHRPWDGTEEGKQRAETYAESLNRFSDQIYFGQQEQMPTKHLWSRVIEWIGLDRLWKRFSLPGHLKQ